jgi:hypothetical protein
LKEEGKKRGSRGGREEKKREGRSGRFSGALNKLMVQPNIPRPQNAPCNLQLQIEMERGRERRWREGGGCTLRSPVPGKKSPNL